MLKAFSCSLLPRLEGTDCQQCSERVDSCRLECMFLFLLCPDQSDGRGDGEGEGGGGKEGGGGGEEKLHDDDRRKGPLYKEVFFKVFPSLRHGEFKQDAAGLMGSY